MSLSIGLVRDSDGVVRFTIVGQFTPSLARELEKNQERLMDGIVIEADAPIDDLKDALSALQALLGFDVNLCQAFEYLLHKNWPQTIASGVLDGNKFDPDDCEISDEVSDAVTVLDILFQTSSMAQAFESVLRQIKPLGTSISRRLYSAETLYARERAAWPSGQQSPEVWHDNPDDEPGRSVHH